MIEKQNVTLSLPKNLLRKAKMVALDQETSLSGLMVDLLTELVDRREQYTFAKETHLATLAEGLDMGTNGEIVWTRESLYER
ncbi:MAG: CopG family transcriptional regulator [Caldilineaceae bacterium]|nr:CopG family transcriptional regulator [Caldilineaceae bacterium]